MNAVCGCSARALDQIRKPSTPAEKPHAHKTEHGAPEKPSAIAFNLPESKSPGAAAGRARIWLRLASRGWFLPVVGVAEFFGFGRRQTGFTLSAAKMDKGVDKPRVKQPVENRTYDHPTGPKVMTMCEHRWKSDDRSRKQ